MDIIFEIVAIVSLTLNILLWWVLWRESQWNNDRITDILESKANRQATQGTLSRHVEHIEELETKIQSLENHFNIRFVTKPEQQLYEKKEEEL